MRKFIVLFCIFISGSIFQIAFWKTADKTIIQALLSNSIFWVVYFVVGVLCAEHIHNFFRRRKENGTDIHDSPIMALFFFALEEEAAPCRKAASWDTPIILTGIGKTNAEEIARKFLTGPKPNYVLTCGFAGGLNPKLQLGEVVFETPDENLRTKLVAAGAKPAKFFCADRIATTVAEKTRLRYETGADAVEMESKVIQAVCRERGIPCATVRVISDTADEDLPLDFNKLSKSDLSLDYAELTLAVAKSPGKIPALLRLQKNCKFAAEQLAEVLLKVA
jgi:adenosylhomocysteine nucleosidase